MTKSTVSDNRKNRIGRPPVGAILIGVRVPPADVAVLDAWIKKNEPEMSRPEAIRRLVEFGLKAARPTKAPRSTSNKLRAADLAVKTIEKMGDPDAHPDERAQRRRRLTKGPPEFREDRVDLPSAKK